MPPLETMVESQGQPNALSRHMAPASLRVETSDDAFEKKTDSRSQQIPVLRNYQKFTCYQAALWSLALSHVDDRAAKLVLLPEVFPKIEDETL